MTCRVMFYVQHLLGIGHLARASRIASAMVAHGMQVTLVTGGLPVPGFPGEGVGHLALPSLTVSDGAFSGLMTADRVMADQAFLDHRRDLLLATFRDLVPDVVITEAFPFGRRQMRFELYPLLDAIAAARPRPLLLASVRDILQSKMKPGRHQETVETVLMHYDRILVHGDPAFARLEDTFILAHQIADHVDYTGLVAGPVVEPSSEIYDIVVSAGGGAVGKGIVFAATAAAHRLPHLRWMIVTGPNLSQADYETLARDLPQNVIVERFRTDFPQLVAATRLSVSQAGYNTVADILQAGCRAILVPYGTHGETEQIDRAIRLQSIGRADVVREDQLDGECLADAIVNALATAPPGPRADLATDGAKISAEIVNRLWRKL